MSDLVPADEQISRKALERIIQRAAELQASERELGDSLTEEQVMELGREVGLPARYLQQALLEEKSRSIGDGGWLSRFVGPARVTAQRTIQGDRDDIEAALGYWMTENELLTVKRRFKQQTSWESRRDLAASIKRGLGLSGKRYALSRAKEIIGEVRQLEEGWCHVTLSADLSNSRRDYLAGGTAFAGAGTAFTIVALVLSVAVPVAVIPVAVGAVGGGAIARGQVGVTERVHVALEQVLDRLEHGEASPPKTGPTLPSGSQITKMLKDEFRRHLS